MNMIITLHDIHNNPIYINIDEISYFIGKKEYGDDEQTVDTNSILYFKHNNDCEQIVEDPEAIKRMINTTITLKKGKSR